MSYSPITGTGSGVAPVVNLTWPFITPAHVKATAGGVDQAFTWTGASQITFSNVVANGVGYEVYRETPIDTPLVEYSDVSVLSSADLDLADTQLRYRQEELDVRVPETLDLVASNEALTDALAVVASIPSAAIPATNRAALKVLSTATPGHLMEAGRAGMFVFKSGNQSAFVTADAREGVYVAPTSDPTGASGAWVRQFDGAVNVKWFGATGDGVTDDSAAFTGALALLKAIAANDAGIYKGSPKLYIPAGHYFLNGTTLEITHTLIIEGDGTGLAGGNATKLRWAAGVTGIRVQRYNTSGSGTVDGVTHYGGDATTIQQLQLYGGFTTLASEGAFHAIHAKARVLVRDVFIQNWQGSGIYIQATAGGGAGLEGNANQFALERVTAWYNQNGIFIDGADANAGYSLGADVSYNRQWGIWDSSFLGNAHIAPHAANNGFADNGLAGPPYLPPTLVSQGGNRYYVLAGQEVGASTNAPSGTTADNTWWGYASPGGVLGASIPAWVSGTTYRTGGPYRTDDVSASITFVNAYTEGGQAPPQFNAGSTLAVGGLWGTGFGNRFGGYYSGNSTRIAFRKDINVGRNLEVTGNAFLGPAVGTPAADANIFIRNTNGFGWLNFQSYDTAGSLLFDDGYIFGEQGIGLVINGRSTTNAIRLRSNGSTIGTVKSAGFDLSAGKVLQVNGVQVVQARETGWSADTGTAKKTANATYSGTAEVGYTQATIQTLMNAVRDISQTQKSIKDALIAHGLIGA